MIENVPRRASKTARIDDVVVVKRYIFDGFVAFLSPERITDLEKGASGLSYPLCLIQKTLGACPQKNDVQSVQETLSYQINHLECFVPTEDTLLPSSHRSPKSGQPLADMGGLGDKTFPADCNVCLTLVARSTAASTLLSSSQLDSSIDMSE
jgi:hypothetical protein